MEVARLIVCGTGIPDEGRDRLAHALADGAAVQARGADVAPRALPPGLLSTAVAVAQSLQDPLIERVYQLLRAGRSVWLDGMGGTGKSYALRFVCARLIGEGVSVACTASTGCAAVGYGEFGLRGSTLHSFAKIGLGKDSAECCARRWFDPRRRQMAKALKVLAIDEMSMLSGEVFDLVDRVFRIVRERPSEPFGGLTLAVCGDLLQLRPVEGSWIFKSAAWRERGFERVLFAVPYRYASDLRYFDMMRRARFGECTPEDVELLRGRVGKACDGPVKPTTLFPHKRSAEELNERELAKLPGKPQVFTARDEWIDLRKRGRSSPMMPDTYRRQLDDAIPARLTLKTGAHVMIKKNMNVGLGIVNGTRGVVTSIACYAVKLNLVGGRETTVTPSTWTVGTDEEIAGRTQIPLILAWGLTIHKSQGATLDCATCDVGPRVFSPGQAYVALSRLRSLEGLHLLALDERVIRCDAEAKEFLDAADAAADAEDGDDRQRKRPRADDEDEDDSDRARKRPRADSKDGDSDSERKRPRDDAEDSDRARKRPRTDAADGVSAPAADQAPDESAREEQERT